MAVSKGVSKKKGAAKNPTKPRRNIPVKKKTSTIDNSKKKKSAVDPSKKKTVAEQKTPEKIQALHDCYNSSDNLVFYLQEVTKNPNPISLEFWYAPVSITSTKSAKIEESKTQGSGSQTLYYSFTPNKRLKLKNILFDGKQKGILPTEVLKTLDKMQEVSAKNTLKVFELLVKNQKTDKKSIATASYGKFVVVLGDIIELQREPSNGLPLRIALDLELIEVADFQLDLGQDLSIPKTLVPTLPKELTAAAEETGKTTGEIGTAIDGQAIPAGTVIGRTGSYGDGAHLHFQFRRERGNLTGLWWNSSSNPAVDKSYNEFAKGKLTGVYPKNILDAITSNDKPLSQIQNNSGVYLRSRNGQTRRHEGMDIACAKGSELVIKVPMYYNNRRDKQPPRNGKEDIGFILDLECREKGLEGFYLFMHLNSISPAALVARPTSANLQTKGNAASKNPNTEKSSSSSSSELEVAQKNVAQKSQNSTGVVFKYGSFGRAIFTTDGTLFGASEGETIYEKRLGYRVVKVGGEGEGTPFNFVELIHPSNGKKIKLSTGQEVPKP